jgi:hypothetical protein
MVESSKGLSNTVTLQNAWGIGSSAPFGQQKTQMLQSLINGIVFAYNLSTAS